MINPDGVRHQIHGNVIQSTSRALMEEVSFDRNSVTAREWGAYPIIKFPDVPKIDVLMLPRQDQPPLGVGESASVPSAAAIANAIFDATGVRFRELPFTPERILRGLHGEAPAGARGVAGACAAPNQMEESVRRAARRVRRARRGLRDRDCHRHGGAAMAGDRADRAARSIGVLSRDHCPRPAACRARRLHGLPHQHQWRAKCRRAADADAVRNHLQHQHHAGRGDRDRQLVLSRVRALDARGHSSRRQTSLSGIPLYAFCQGHRRRSAGALRFPDGADAGARGNAGECARLPVQPAGR